MLQVAPPAVLKDQSVMAGSCVDTGDWQTDENGEGCQFRFTIGSHVAAFSLKLGKASCLGSNGTMCVVSGLWSNCKVCGRKCWMRLTLTLTDVS